MAEFRQPKTKQLSPKLVSAWLKCVVKLEKFINKLFPKDQNLPYNINKLNLIIGQRVSHLGGPSSDPGDHEGSAGFRVFSAELHDALVPLLRVADGAQVLFSPS